MKGQDLQSASTVRKVIEALRCPSCRGPIHEAGEQEWICGNEGCRKRFPVVSGIPVLIDEGKSIFAVRDFVQKNATTFKPQTRFKRMWARVVPTNGINLAARDNYRRLTALLKSVTRNPKVLVVGGGVVGEGFEVLLDDPEVLVVETDVSLGERVAMICDAHDLPFESETFDAVVVQAVLEHVVDPVRCVNEVHRVLKPAGLVYSETPFMQQVHMGRYDFTRFTHLGHRRLFRRFSEVSSGVVCGPGMALAWAYEYFLISFATVPALRAGLRVLARFTSFYLKYFDHFLVHKPGAFDAASGFWFMGRKSEGELDDRELIRSYKGAL